MTASASRRRAVGGYLQKNRQQAESGSFRAATSLFCLLSVMLPSRVPALSCLLVASIQALRKYSLKNREMLLLSVTLVVSGPFRERRRVDREFRIGYV